jgi:hypothetical protein
MILSFINLTTENESVNSDEKLGIGYAFTSLSVSVVSRPGSVFSSRT